MKLKHVAGARLTLDSGQEITLERLGKGMFHTCYVDRTTKQVYSITIERETGADYSKEILSRCDPSLHIPPVEELGALDGKDNRVYRMPLYEPIRASHKEAWDLLKRLEQAKDDAWKAIVAQEVTPRKMRVDDIGCMVNSLVCEMTDAPGIPQSLKDALESLRDEASNYGSDYVFEFSRRNVMVDGNGVLILLDVLFSLKTVEAIWKARRNKQGGR